MSSNTLPGSVQELMTSHIVALAAGSTMHEAIQMMVENRVHALPVIDSASRCVGIITSTDLIEVTYDIDSDLSDAELVDPSANRRLIERISSSIGAERVESYAAEVVASIPQTATLVAAAKVMTKEQIHHLPVVDDDGVLVGILSSADLVAVMADWE